MLREGGTLQGNLVKMNNKFNPELFNFVCWLSTRPKTISVGGNAEFSYLIELYKEFCELNNIRIGDDEHGRI